METTLARPQPLHFHAPHKTPATRPDAGQRVWSVAEVHSIFYGDKLLTTGNPDVDADGALLQRLGLRTGKPMPTP